MALVMGVDSSTQSCKVVVTDAATGAVVRSGRASHHLARIVEQLHAMALGKKHLEGLVGQRGIFFRAAQRQAD